MFKLKSNKMKYKIPRRVRLEINDSDMMRRDRQDSAFYTWKDSHTVAALVYRGRKIFVVCSGDMLVRYRNELIEYSDQLIGLGIENDEDLSKIELEGGEWINNSWFEIFDTETHIFPDTVFHTIEDAIEAALAELKYSGLSAQPEQAIGNVNLGRW